MIQQRTRRSAWLAFAAAMVMGVGAWAQAPLPERGVPQSCGVQLKPESWNADTLKKAHEMGFKVVRKGFYWNAVEKEKGVYDFSKSDEQMKLAKELDLTVVVTLFSGNKLYGEDKGGVTTPEGRAGFAKFAAAAAEKYKGEKVIFEIWNEPNVRTFWRKDGTHNSDPFATEYTDLVKAVMPEMLAADPNAFVVAGSVSNYWQPSYEWTEMCFKKGILKTGIKGWSVHPYGVKTPEEFAIGHKITRDLLSKYGSPDMPMLDTERGFSVKETAEGWSGGSKEKTLEFQAWHIVRQYMADMMADVRLTVWYEWGGDEFGLVDKSGTRPAAVAVQTMLKELNGYHYVARIDTGYENDYVLQFQDAAGKQKLVVWTAQPKGDSPDMAFPHPVDLTSGGAGAVQAVGLLGDKVDVAGDAKSFRITVAGGPQYLTVPAGAKFNAKSIEPFAAPVKVVAAEVPDGAVDLKLFEDKAKVKFVENTGKGSFELGKDGEKPIGILTYDFTSSKATGKPYVLGIIETSIAEGPSALVLNARSGVKQPLTFRLTDDGGQTHQFKTKITGSGQWEQIKIPLNKKLEHWGGANDGKIHFPIKSVSFSVPLPDDEHKQGKVEFSDAATTK